MLSAIFTYGVLMFHKSSCSLINISCRDVFVQEHMEEFNTHPSDSRLGIKLHCLQPCTLFLLHPEERQTDIMYLKTAECEALYIVCLLERIQVNLSPRRTSCPSESLRSGFNHQPTNKGFKLLLCVPVCSSGWILQVLLPLMSYSKYETWFIL